MNKVDILSVCTALILAFSLRGYNDQGNIATLALQSSANIVFAGNNQTIGSLYYSLEPRDLAATEMAKPRQAAPPMHKSCPIRSPPKPSPKPKPTKKYFLFLLINK